MPKRRLEIITALHEFSRVSQGTRRRNSCYAFMLPQGSLDLSLIRRHPVAAFWAFAESVGGPTPAQKSVKSGERILVEIHLYVPHDGSELRPARRKPTTNRGFIPADDSDQDQPAPDRDVPHWNVLTDL